ncbi:MAG: protein-L-isoaspartate(D-aspartate) O-methyltransferase [Pirellulaceae bacterium]
MSRDRVKSCSLVLGVLGAAFCSFQTVASAQRVDSFEAARETMVQREVSGRGVRDQRVTAAMRKVPRHLFVPPDQRKYAYLDGALPIGNGQTITSPYVVAFMTEQLEPQTSDKVLEIGTGSGYQASVLSRIVAEVYTIEIVEPLGRRATQTIQRLGYSNVHVKIGDGYQGWPEHAPFDKIIVTCSPENVPQALVDQLKEGGRLVVPLGERFQQTLYLFRKTAGQLEKETLESTFFVPMTGMAEELRTAKNDSGIPQPVNAGFEQTDPGNEVVGWFYIRQARIVEDATAPEGRHCLVLTNSVAGQNAHVMQAVGLDGRKLKSVLVSVQRRTRGIGGQVDQSRHPRVDLTFYDEGRALIRTVTLGPWDGDQPWSDERTEVAVPGRARFGVITIGMFGTTGEFAVDDLQVVGKPQP